MGHKTYNDELLAELTSFHLRAERAIRQRIDTYSQRYCGRCAEPCCRAEFCKEAGESFFLSAVIRAGGGTVQADYRSAQGCLLAVGKPLICHEYFCYEILTKEAAQLSETLAMIRGLKKVYAGFHGGRSLLAVPEASLTDRRLARVIEKAQTFTGKWLTGMPAEPWGQVVAALVPRELPACG